MSFPYADDEFIHMWVADMEFATPDVVIEGMRKRLDRRIFGYTRVYDPGYYEAFRGWCDRRYGWTFPKHELVMSNGVIPALYELVEYITEPDEKVLFLTPSYAYFKYAADFNTRPCVCSDLLNENGHYRIDFDDLDRTPTIPPGAYGATKSSAVSPNSSSDTGCGSSPTRSTATCCAPGSGTSHSAKACPNTGTSSPAWRRARRSTSPA